MYRGFNDSLISRVQNSRYGDRHYLDTETLQFFDSYGGRHYRVTDDIFIVVESVRYSAQPRQYRGVRFMFSGEPSRETVITQVITDHYLSAASVERAIHKLLVR